MGDSHSSPMYGRMEFSYGKSSHGESNLTTDTLTMKYVFFGVFKTSLLKDELNIVLK